VRPVPGPASAGPGAHLRARPALAALITVLLVVALLALTPVAPARAAEDVATEDARVPSGAGADAVELDTTLYVPSSATADAPAPAVLLAHGFGGSKASVAADARDLAGRGYVVLTWSARGFGTSTGQIGLDDPRFEVADVTTLLDRLAQRDDVLLDAPGDPRVGVAGGSYGGALSLLAAAYDQRIDAIAPSITWNSLTSALFPESAGTVAGAGTVAAGPASTDAGVFKRSWAGLFFGVGSAPTGGGPLGGPAGLGGGPAPADGAGGRDGVPGRDDAAADPAAVAQALTCGRFRADICAAYQTAASIGTLTPEIAAVLDRSNPATVLDRITAPTLLVQGTQDSLFGLAEADANARGIAANGTPVSVVWYAGGHDTSPSDRVAADLRDRVAGWFDVHLRGADPAPGQEAGFSYPAPTGLGGGGVSVQGGTQTVDAASYPGLAGSAPAQRGSVPVEGPTQPVVTPAGGSPAALTTVPGLGAVTAALGGATIEIPSTARRWTRHATSWVPRPGRWRSPRRAGRRRCSPSSTTSPPTAR
jgi:ABC-2 type transport system ATP-binding protein